MSANFPDADEMAASASENVGEADGQSAKHRLTAQPSRQTVAPRIGTSQPR